MGECSNLMNTTQQTRILKVRSYDRNPSTLCHFDIGSIVGHSIQRHLANTFFNQSKPLLRFNSSWFSGMKPTCSFPHVIFPACSLAISRRHMTLYLPTHFSYPPPQHEYLDYSPQCASKPPSATSAPSPVSSSLSLSYIRPQ